MTTRREFIVKSVQAAGVVPFLHLPLEAMTIDELNEPLNVSLFSKHLQFLDCPSAAAAAAEMGFDGLDLTVRPNGHVEPSTVKTELPRAVERIRAAGSNCSMITTNIENVQNQSDVDIIETAAAAGVKYYRTNWFKYSASTSMPETLEYYTARVKELSLLSKKLRITGCYQNHAGRDVGSSFWEVHTILRDADLEYFGAQYDIRHAVVEGAFSWENGFQLLLPKIKMIVLKDFKWEKTGGKWQILNTPIGDGMVDFNGYFKKLKKAGVKPPVSLHCEYPMGGAERGDRKITVDPSIVFNTMKKDLIAIQRLWQEA